MCFKKVTYLLLLLCFTTSLSAQDAPAIRLDSFAAKMITSIRTNARERAYITTDKSVYKSGEYVWFNALLLNGVSQKWSSKSKYLFVDIVDENDRPVKRLILDATARQLHSRIQLPDTLTGGNYWLRAYTKQMAAQDSANAGVKPLYVLGKTNNHPAAKTTMSKKDDSGMPALTFFPEGGNMITGIDATVAVTASSSDGTPLSINGIIKDNRDTVIASFATNANGLGKFQFEPSGFRQYKAIINYNGKERSYALPPFNFFKGQIAVTKQPDSYGLRILLGDSIYKKNALTYVAGVAKDSLVFAAFGKGLYQVNVAQNKLPQGITTFYLFDTGFNLLSERSVYNNNNVLVNITTDKSNYNNHDKVSLNVAVTDAAQHPIPALISISVSDSVLAYKQPCRIADVGNIPAVDNLFLASHPCFSAEELDLLMLAQHARYSQIMKPAEPVINATDDSLFYVSGTVLKGKTGGANKVVTLISNDGSEGLFYRDTTDNTGRFYFALDSHPDSMQFALEVRDLSNYVVNNGVVTDSFAFPKFTTPVALKQPIAAALKPAIDRLQRQYDVQSMEEGVHRLPPVTVKDEIADYDVTKRVSTTSAIISGKAFDGRTTVDNVLLRVSGLQVINGFLVMRGLSNMKKPDATSEPLLVVDGVPVFATANSGIGNVSPIMSYLSTLNPKEIDFIEVLKDGGAANYGVRGSNGVILINTNKLSHDIFINSNMKVFYANGISRPALFPIYTYNEKDKKAALQSDVRTTIFWNGNFLTNRNDNNGFTFYTSDVPATYTVTVTGITQYGDLIYKTISFRSK